MFSIYLCSTAGEEDGYIVSIRGSLEIKNKCFT